MKVYRPVGAQYRISSPYGPRIDPVTKKEGSFHYGVDFAVPEGIPIIAALAGKIDAVGWENPNDKRQGFGYRVRQLVAIEGKQYYLYYAHLSSSEAKANEVLEAGTRVGLSGNTGKSSGPHLHFEIREIGGKGLPIEFI